VAVITRPLKVVDYEDAGSVRVNIPRQHFLNRLRIKVNKGTLTGGTAGAFVAGAANKMIKRLELTIGGQLTVTNLSFENLRRLNLLAYKDQYPGEGYAFLDLGMLPTHLFTSLELHITFASIQELQAAGGDHTAITGAKVVLHSREVINEGQDVGRIPIVVRKTVHKDLQNIQGETAIDIRDGQVIQAILIRPSSQTLLKHVSVIQDGVKFHRTREPWDQLREENRADFEMDAAPVEWAVLNFDSFGDGSQALRTKPMDTLELVVDTNAEPDGALELVVLEVQAPQ
jgi:hypothetical protein